MIVNDCTMKVELYTHKNVYRYVSIVLHIVKQIPLMHCSCSWYLATHYKKTAINFNASYSA